MHMKIIYYTGVSIKYHPASYPMGAGALSLGEGAKRPGHEDDRSHPSSVEVKNCGALPPLPHTSSWRDA
jgi:hypothetical protein